MLKSNHSSDFEKHRQHYKKLIGNLEGLPSLPEIVLEIQMIIKEDKLSAGEIAPIIDRDPSLAVKLLKIVNSAYYGQSKKLDSLRQAIVIIGIRGISNLIMGISIVQAFNISDDDDAFNWKRYWVHSNLVGNFCEMLNSKLKLWVPASPFTLGLLHDIGKLVLFKLDPEKYKKSQEFSKLNKCDSVFSEIEYFGINHMEAGRWIAEKWDLPEATRYAIGYHHNPKETPDVEFQETVKLVKLCDLILNYHDVRFGNRMEKGEINDSFIEHELFNNIDFAGKIDSMDEIIDDIAETIDTLKDVVAI